MATATKARKTPAATTGGTKAGTNGKPPEGEQVKGQQELIASPQPATEKIKLPGDQYAVVKALAEAGGMEKKVDTSAWDASNKKALSALRKREGVLEIKPADLAKVGRGDSVNAAKLLMPLDAFVASTRAARTTTGAPRTRRNAQPQLPERYVGVTVEALETFLTELKTEITARTKTEEGNADKAIAEARKAVTNATTDDDAYNAGVQLQTAIRAKRELRKNVAQELLKTRKASDESAHLQPIYAAMIDRG